MPEESVPAEVHERLAADGERIGHLGPPNFQHEGSGTAAADQVII